MGKNALSSVKELQPKKKLTLVQTFFNFDIDLAIAYVMAKWSLIPQNILTLLSYNNLPCIIHNV